MTKNGKPYNAWHFHNNEDFANVPPVVVIIASMEIIDWMKLWKTKKYKKITVNGESLYGSLFTVSSHVDNIPHDCGRY